VLAGACRLVAAHTVISGPPDQFFSPQHAQAHAPSEEIGSLVIDYLTVKLSQKSRVENIPPASFTQIT
jgi:hypothetical protein